MNKIILKEENLGNYEKSLISRFNNNVEIINSQSTSIDDANELMSENIFILTELDELDTFNEDIMFEMANFRKEKSGLDFNIWIDDAGSARTNKYHKPRIKVQDPDDKRNLISVSISDKPKILAGQFLNSQNLKKLFDFISDNYDDLMKVWNQEIDATDFIIKHTIK